MCCLNCPPQWRLSPLALAASVAVDGAAAQAERARWYPATSFRHAELCAAVSALARGAFAASPMEPLTTAAQGRAAGVNGGGQSCGR
jgi:hypothetical protein